MTHFLAGYYSGYTDGFNDGADELVIEMVGRQQSQAQNRDTQGRNPDQMQPGRRDARESMRGKMRGEWSGSMTDAKNKPQKDGQTKDMSKTMSNRSPMPEMTVTGTVTDVKLVPVRDTKIQHRIVRVETKDGERKVVDLGPNDQTGRLNIREGERIEVRGRRVVSGDFRIVAATRVTVGGKTADIQYKTWDVRDNKGVNTNDNRPNDRRDR